MFVGITNDPRDYAWGSRTAIAELLGRPASGGPEAELWLGAHPASPSHVTDASAALHGRDLDELIAADPVAMLGVGRTRLPFLLKVLAADAPLSLQAHPDSAGARAGFEAEQAAGVPIDAETRNYKDESHKPELILALSPVFEALAGFRHVSETRLLLAELAVAASGDDRSAITALGARLASGDPARAGSTGSSADVNADGVPATAETTPDHAGSHNPLEQTVEWLLGGGDEVEHLVAAVVAAAAHMGDRSSFGREWATVTLLAEAHPGDPGIVLSLLLNHVSLTQGQVLALPAGNLHAYLEGVGIELMASSDNVLRGGLTKKHVDVPELLRVLRFESLPSPIVRPEHPVDGITVWRPEVDDFVLAEVALGDAAAIHGYRVAGPERAAFDLTGPAIVLVLTGGVRIDGATGSTTLARGDATYITPDERTLTFTGSGVAYVATTP